MIGPVEDLKHVSTDELIISIKSKHYRVLTTVINRCIITVMKCTSPLRVLYIGVMFLVNRVKTKIVTVDFTAIVTGMIIDNNRFVVGVILSEDGVEVGLDAELVIVIVAGYCNTYW